MELRNTCDINEIVCETIKKSLYETPKVERLGEIADLTSDSWTNSITIN